MKNNATEAYMKNLELNRKLAALLGWTNIIETGGALLGTPPDGEYCVRGQCLVPDWAGDWRDCGPLIAEHWIYLRRTSIRAAASSQGDYLSTVFYAACESEDAAMRAAVVSAVINKLEAQQHG